MWKETFFSKGEHIARVLINFVDFGFAFELPLSRVKTFINVSSSDHQ